MPNCQIILLTLVFTANLRAEEIQVTADFSGGSAEVQEIDQAKRLVRLKPTAHEGRGWVCWVVSESQRLDAGRDDHA